MLDYIKCIHNLKGILEYIDEYKKLKLFNYTKKYQNKIGLSIEDYKKYIEIEIELKLIDDLKQKKIYFISKDYYYSSLLHIYFNNESKEQKRIFITDREKISNIKIIIDNNITSFKSLFQDCKCIKEIKFIKFNRKNIKNMSYMFYQCSSLINLDISKFRTDNVINM